MPFEHDKVRAAAQMVADGMNQLNTLLPDEIHGTVTFRSREEAMNPHTIDCTKPDCAEDMRAWAEKILENGPLSSRGR